MLTLTENYEDYFLYTHSDFQEAFELAKTMGLDASGAIIGTACAYVQPMPKAGAGLFLLWASGNIHRPFFRELRPNWGINMLKYTHDAGIAEVCCSNFFYNFYNFKFFFQV